MFSTCTTRLLGEHWHKFRLLTSRRVTAVCHSLALSLLFQLVSRVFQTSYSLSLGVFLKRPSKLQVKKPILSHPVGQSLSPSNLDISTWIYSIPLCHTGSVRSRQDGNAEWADHVSTLLIMWALAYSSVTLGYALLLSLVFLEDCFYPFFFPICKSSVTAHHTNSTLSSLV